MVKGEIITLGAAAGALGGAYKLSEFLLKAKRIRDVGPSNAVYVRIIGRVRADLDEVRRLLSVREVHDALESNPEKSRWVYGAMRDVRGALENISPHTERVASDVEDGRRIGIRHRVYWLVSEKEKLENREKELTFAHNSLSEVLGFLTTLEPIDEPHKPESKSSKKETHVDIDIHQHQDAPQHTTERIERDIRIEHRDAGPRRVEEHRDVWIERDRQGPPAHYEERRDVYIDDRERGPQHFDERDVHIHEHRGPHHDAPFDDHYSPQDQYSRHPPPPQYAQERRHEGPQYDSRPFPEPLGRRPESYEDRLAERDSWHQSAGRRNGPPPPQQQQGAYNEYAEYGAPQPIGAAPFQRRFRGDAGFGDEEILNPQPVPLSREYQERELWIEQKEDYRFDQYGNKLPDRLIQQQQQAVPRPYRSRM